MLATAEMVAKRHVDRLAMIRLYEQFRADVKDVDACLCNHYESLIFPAIHPPERDSLLFQVDDDFLPSQPSQDASDETVLYRALPSFHDAELVETR